MNIIHNRTWAFTIIIAIISSLSGCGKSSVRSIQMDQAENIMNSRPDLALSILNNIHPNNLNGKKQRARYALLKSMALDRNYIDTTTFDVLQPAIDHYLEHGTSDEKLKTYYYQGIIYQNQGKLDLALDSYMQGRRYCSDVADTIAVAKLLVAEGALKYDLYELNDYINNNLRAARLFGLKKNTEHRLFCLTNAFDGSVISKNKNLADSILTAIREVAGNDADSNPQLAQSMVSYYTAFGSKDDVRNILTKLASQPKVGNKLLLNVTMAYCKLNDASNANLTFNSIDTTGDVKSSLKYMAVLPEVLALNGRYREAHDAYKLFSLKVDSMHQEIFKRDMSLAQIHHQKELAHIDTVRHKNQQIMLCLAIAMALCIVIGVIHYKYKLAKARHLLDETENERLAAEKQNAELKYHQQSLAKENLQLKIEQLEAEQQTLKNLVKERDIDKPVEDAIRIRIEMLNKLFASLISDNDTYSQDYNAWVESVLKDKDTFMDTTRLALKASHPRFIDYLEKRGMTEAEINYVCLYAIGLRGKEVGNYIQMKRHYHISSDVRKKLGIDKHQTNLSPYIRKLMREL